MTSHVDESLLTGEPLPIEKKKGDEVVQEQRMGEEVLFFSKKNWL